jgi:putative transposase
LTGLPSSARSGRNGTPRSSGYGPTGGRSSRAFLQFDTEIRTIICTTNAIESINARIRRAVNARGHFPNEQAALKCVYLAIMSLDPTGKGRTRWSNRWKAALNAFEITFDGRLSAGRN